MLKIITEETLANTTGKNLSNVTDNITRTIGQYISGDAAGVVGELLAISRVGIIFEAELGQNLKAFI